LQRRTVTGGAAIVDGKRLLGLRILRHAVLGSSTPVLNNNKVYAFSLR